jgi:hypothetical protein
VLLERHPSLTAAILELALNRQNKQIQEYTFFAGSRVAFPLGFGLFDCVGVGGWLVT